MAELNAYDCHQNVTEPQATEYQKKVHVCTGTVSQAMQHKLQVETTWTDDSTLASSVASQKHSQHRNH